MVLRDMILRVDQRSKGNDYHSRYGQGLVKNYTRSPNVDTTPAALRGMHKVVRFWV